MSGTVQIHVDGKPQGDPMYLADGDQVLFTMPGILKNGRLTIAEERIAGLERQLRAYQEESAKYQKTIREMADAKSLDEAVGIAFRAGALRDEEW